MYTVAPELFTLFLVLGGGTSRFGRCCVLDCGKKLSGFFGEIWMLVGVFNALTARGCLDACVHVLSGW